MTTSTMRSIVALSLAIAAGLLTTAATPVEAQHSTIRLDNSPNGGSVTGGTTTVNEIVILVQFCGSTTWQMPVPERVLNSVSGKHDFRWYNSAYRGKNIRRFQISINAQDPDDWFWLDQVELLWNYGGEERIWSAGLDNTQGWCFSDAYLRPNNTACEPDDSLFVKTWDIPGSNCPNQ